MASQEPLPVTASPVTVDLASRNALVTGGASGIGRACALRLAAAGARVDILDLDGGAANDVAARTGAVPTRSTSATSPHCPNCFPPGTWRPTSS